MATHETGQKGQGSRPTQIDIPEQQELDFRKRKEAIEKNRVASYRTDRFDTVFLRLTSVVVDPVIRFALFILLLSTTLFVSVHLVTEIWSVFRTGSEASVLKISEMIFIHFLPIFILIGFNNYYYKLGRYLIIDGKTSRINEGDAIKPMNLSKVLLISSMFSYGAIKVLEKLSEKETQTELGISAVILSYLALLIVLMAFFYIITRNHK